MMKHFLLILFSLILLNSASRAQELYFPPISGSVWETTAPADLGWCEDSIPQLLDFLEASNSKAFIVLKDGKIVIEHYFGTFTQDSLWYWASAGKSLTATLVGLAQEQGFLNINDPSSDYLGEGWTSLTPEQESQITVWHQLTMTTGLDDSVENVDCTEPECLVYLEDPGDRWSYHNAPYTLLDGVIENATGQNLNTFLYQNISVETGINGLYLQVDYNNVFFSRPRAFARFGLLSLNQGNWNGTQIMEDTDYFYDMTHSSQGINECYGYLWWLNGYDSFMLPGSQFVFGGPLMPDAPQDIYAAMGKNGQICNVSPEENLVVIRMGDAPTNEIFFVPNVYNNDIWVHLNKVMNCSTTSTSEMESTSSPLLYPNPANDLVLFDQTIQTVSVFNALGEKVWQENSPRQLFVNAWKPGIYMVQLQQNNHIYFEKLIVE